MLTVVLARVMQVKQCSLTSTRMKQSQIRRTFQMSLWSKRIFTSHDHVIHVSGHWSNCQLKTEGRYKKRLEWKFLLGSEKWLIWHATLETLFYGNAVCTEIKTAFSDSALKIYPNLNNRCKLKAVRARVCLMITASDTSMTNWYVLVSSSDGLLPDFKPWVSKYESKLWD